MLGLDPKDAARLNRLVPDDPAAVRKTKGCRTGVALALYEDGKPIDCLGETAKAVLNLLCTPEPSSDTNPNPFQQGQLSSYLSKNKLDTLVPGLKDMRDEDGAKLSELLAELDLTAVDIANIALGGLLHDALPIPVQTGSGSTEQQDPGQQSAEAKDRAEEAAHSALVALGQRLLAKSELAGVAAESLHEAVRSDSVATAIAALGRACDKPHPDTATLREKCARLPNPPAWKDLKDRRPDQCAAVACAWVLGRWLADAIALCWELYRIREVRLAGGPLRGATGLYIAESACDALRHCYGFDIDAQHGREGNHPVGLDWYASMRRREIKALRVVDPPASSDEGGPRGVAEAALDAYCKTRRLEQLRACRSQVAEMNQVFDAVTLKDKVLSAMGSVPSPCRVATREVAEMLERESAVLGLTRERDGRFRRWD
jgi:hypothetical protein